MFEETTKQVKWPSEQGIESQRGCSLQHWTPVAVGEKAAGERAVHAEAQMRIGGIRSLLLALAMLLLSAASFAQVHVSVRVAPPELPVYEQPICAGDGYIWTPGYWAWDDGYYWVPGTWVMPPEVGFL